MQVTERAIDSLRAVRSVNVESDLVRMIAEHYSLSVEEALRAYYETDLADRIASNENGEQFLDSTYLFDEFLRQASDEK